MRQVILLFILLMGTFAGACAAPPTAAPLATPIPENAPTAAASPVVSEKPTIRLANPASPGIADVPYLMAIDRLKTLGYKVETTQFARFDLAVAAAANGELDFVSSSMQPVWSAVGKGAPLLTIVARLRNADLLVVKSDIQTCADLANRNVALSSATAVNAVLLNQYINRHCPGTTYQTAAIPSSTNRLAALQSGSVDAANLQLDDLLQLQQEQGSKFHALVNFGDEFPEIQVYAFHVHKGFAAQHPEAVRDFVRALLESVRAIQDKQALLDAAVKYLSLERSATDNAATEYLAQKMWDVNGELSDENLQTTLEFFIQADAVPNTLTLKDVADLTYLNAALDEIGRK